MFAVEIYAAVRRFVFVEGKSRREAARVFGLSRDTIAKMCRYSAPPGYVRSKAPERPKLGPLVPVIGREGLRSDRPHPVARGLRAAGPSAWPCAGRFRRMHGVIGGVRMKLRVFCFDLPQSDACFIKAYPADHGGERMSAFRKHVSKAFRGSTLLGSLAAHIRFSGSGS